MIKLLLADDQALVRGAMAALLDMEPDLKVVAEVGRGDQVVAAALAASHITCELPGAADEVPTRNRELFAWTIREAVTNIVRHSRASRCEVRLAADSVEIVDNGSGPGVPDPDGQGLQGLRRRADALGAKLTVGDREDDQPGFRVRVEVPT